MTDEHFPRSRAMILKCFKDVMENKAYANGHRLPMVVICRPTTKDFPGKWVARLHFCLPEPTATDIVFTADSHEMVREYVPAYMSMLLRDPNDDPVIEEVWL